MMYYLLAGIFLGAVLAVLGVRLRQPAWGRVRVPPALAVGLVGPFLVLGLGYVLLERDLHRWWLDWSAPPRVRIVAPPLNPGDRVPPFAAEGWLNGPPPTPGAEGARVIVADLWALW
jgi:hypothetical protein